MNYKLELTPNTDLIETKMPMVVELKNGKLNILFEGARCYNIYRYIWISSGIKKIYDYLNLLVSDWSSFLSTHHPVLIKKNDPILKLVEDDINDFIVVLFEAIREISKDNINLYTGLPNYPINYVKIDVTDTGKLTHTYTQPKDEEGYYHRRLRDMNNYKYTIMKNRIIKVLE